MHVTHAFHAKLYARSRVVRDILGHRSPAVMPMSVEAECEIREIVAQSRGGDFLVRNTQQVFQVLQKHGLLSTMRIPPLLVGVHPQNRDGACLVVQDVHELLESIVQVGFVPTRVNAVGIEVNERSERDFNVQLATSAGQQLGEVDGDSLNVLSLSASHTNWALRLIAGSAPHQSEIISVNGCVSRELVLRRDPIVHAHAVSGLEWQVIAAEVGVKFPELLQVIQASFNASLQKQESEMQLLRRVCTLISRCGEGSAPDYLQIKKQALASKPPCAEALPGLFKFGMRLLDSKHYVSCAFLRVSFPHDCISNAHIYIQGIAEEPQHFSLLNPKCLPAPTARAKVLA